MVKKRMNLIGKRFGRLTVIDFAEDYVPPSNHHVAQWKCRCDCGNEIIVAQNHLRNNHTKSCGCLQKNTVSEKSKKHGMSKTRHHTIWKSMLSRCKTKTGGSYQNYGGRGINVCQEWADDFMNFYCWAIDSGYAENLYLERKNNNGNYCPENCAWITYKEQQRNKRNNHFLTYKGETKTMIEWSEILKINYGTLCYRINVAKWSVEKAFETPIKNVGQK